MVFLIISREGGNKGQIHLFRKRVSRAVVIDTVYLYCFIDVSEPFVRDTFRLFALNIKMYPLSASKTSGMAPVSAHYRNYSPFKRCARHVFLCGVSL